MVKAARDSTYKKMQQILKVDKLNTPWLNYANTWYDNNLQPKVLAFYQKVAMVRWTHEKIQEGFNDILVNVNTTDMQLYCERENMYKKYYQGVGKDNGDVPDMYK